MRRDPTTFKNYEFKNVKAIITVAIPKSMIATVVEKEMDKIVGRIRALEDDLKELKHKLRIKGGMI